jgi:predicted ATPase/class 3 adenylate cyclase
MTGEATRSASPDAAALGLDARPAVQTLAFLFTDIEGSTSLWERYPREMPAALATHDRILRGAVEREGGRIIKTTGDGVMAVFGSARDGLAATLDAQRDLLHQPWSTTGPIRVRMGLHVGEAEADGEGEDYHGPSVNRAARIMASGHGGQALLSAATAALVIDRMPDGASLHDLGEHRLKDLSRPERVYELRHPDLPPVTQPLRTEDAPRFALPAEPSVFVGREAARAQLVGLLSDPEVRLLTLIGPGGIGKTRLALRAARDVERSFDAGAVFVDLSAAQEVGDVLVTISRALGLPDTSAGAQADELARSIGAQRCLLVLDNVEQVTSAATTLAGLLAACPQLHLLVTSREALRVRGERRFVVAPMALPDAATRRPTAADVSTYEAVRLFVERAQAIRSDFEVTDENAAVLADICRRLEGVPLAIELATARLRVFSLEALRDRLDSQLRTLGSGARDLPERQQTLRATIEWSYRLLSPGEQRLFEVLACFAGADAEAVESVTSKLLDLLPDIDPIDGLGSLTDKSLLRQVDRAVGNPRFAMLEAMREFATERLDASDELATRARASHAEHYAAWLTARVPGLARPGRAEVLDSLESEVENLRLVWRWAVAAGDLHRLQALLAGLRPLFDARGWYRGLIELLDGALGVLETLPPSPERVVEAATLQSDRARALASVDGYSDETEAAYERVLATVEGADLSRAYPILRGLAIFHQFRNEDGKALPLARQILAMGEADGDLVKRVSGHMLVGTSLSFMGRLPDGLPDLEAGADLVATAPTAYDWYRLGPDPRVSCLTALSLLCFWEGRLDTSVARSGEAVALARSGGHPSTLGYGLHHASLLRLMRDEPEQARTLAVESIELSTEHDLHVWRAVGTVIMGAATVALGAGDEGMRWIREGLERYRGLRTPPVFWPFMLEVTAIACRLSGETVFGLASIDEAIAVAPRLPGTHLAKAGLLAEDDPIAAAAEYETALAMASGWGARMQALAAARHLYRLAERSDPTAVDARGDQVRDILSGFTEGFDHPLLREARAIAAS